ncbi:MAG: penicillin synthase [Betaproteobacteria bacterium]|nr:penicillin synthase [Betaproteobacteria bacterium]
MIFYTPPKTADHIPVIDFTDAFSPDLAKREAVAWEIHKACRDVGFFYLAGHGVAPAMIEAQFEAARGFFALPNDTKELVNLSRSRSGFGYEPMSGQTLDSGTPPDLKEGFQCGMDLPDDHPYVLRGLERYGLNQWPASLPGFRAQTLAYHAAMMDLSRKLLSIIALSLDIDENFFHPLTETPIATLRMLHYPPQKADAAANQLGAGAHTDWGLVTLLAQDTVGGLEVRNAAGEWIRATPIEGTFVVNTGDLLQRWSNDMYKSNMHRVLNSNTSGRSRYSIPFFQDGDNDAIVSCFESCRDAEHPAKYPDCNVGEYLGMKIRETYGISRAAA